MERELGVLVDKQLNRSVQLLWQKKPTGCIIKGIPSRDKGIVPLYSVLVRPHLEHCAQFWSLLCKIDEDRLERAHRWVTKVMKELGSLAQEERQFSQPFSKFCSALRKKRLRGDLFTKLQHLKGGYKGDGDPFYNESHGKDKG